MRNPTLVVVTDRTDLDDQLFKTFMAAKDLLQGEPERADSRDDLRVRLEDRESGGVIFTTVQKFALLTGETRHPQLSGRENVVVISDEAHRSQYGTGAKLDVKTGEYKTGYAQHLRDALPTATFIGFTGTPISKDDRDTRAVFGDYVSIYDIQDAVQDGATVPIYYESRLAKLDVNQAEIEALSAQVDEVVEDEEDAAAREKAKGTWARLAALVGAEPRLREVAADLVAHYELRTEVFPGKAMIVAMSRDICAALYKEIVALRPEWDSSDPDKGAIKVVMTGSASDKPELQPHLYSSLIKKRLERRFKDPDDPLKLVIVRDMWLTGFDAPSCHTMYVDKPMHGHNLMQAIARVNRVFANKPGGLVVDYIGIAADLRKALKTYVDANGKGEPAIKSEEYLAEMLRYLDAVRGLFHGFDYADFETDGVALLPDAMEHLLAAPGRKERFLDAMAALKTAYARCNTLGEAIDVHTDVAETGDFECSNPLFNRIVEASKWTQRNLMFDVPAGCAARSERLAWTGDVRPCVQTALFNFDTAAFFGKHAADLRDDQKPDGRFTDICPHAHLTGTDICVGSPGWADAGVSLLWDVYVNTGDRRLLAEHYVVAKRWVDFVHAHNPDLIWANARGMDWGDWLSAGRATPKELGSTAFFAHSMDLVARMARVLGHNEDATAYGSCSSGSRGRSSPATSLPKELSGNPPREAAAVRGMVKGDRLALRVGNDSLGVDPALNARKTIRLTWRVGGVSRTREIPEGAPIDLDGDGKGLVVDEAVYGAVEEEDAQGSYALAFRLGLLDEPLRSKAVA